MTLDVSDDLWGDVDSCIKEIEWYATREKTLSDSVDKGDGTWAEMLLKDIADLRAALARVQDSYAKPGTES